jgi:hypothetical protein
MTEATRDFIPFPLLKLFEAVFGEVYDSSIMLIKQSALPKNRQRANMQISKKLEQILSGTTAPFFPSPVKFIEHVLKLVALGGEPVFIGVRRHIDWRGNVYPGGCKRHRDLKTIPTICLPVSASCYCKWKDGLARFFC